MDLFKFQLQIQAIIGEKCTLADLFTEHFIQKTMRLNTQADIQKIIPLDFYSPGVIEDEVLQEFVTSYTDFDTWEQLLTDATIQFQQFDNKGE